jgi:hypothetical protein
VGCGSFELAEAGLMIQVYMSFFLRQRWHVAFLQADLKTPLRRKLVFQDSAEIVQLVEHAGGLTDPSKRLMLDRDIGNGRGGMYLILTDEQYKRLL